MKPIIPYERTAQERIGAPDSLPMLPRIVHLLHRMDDLDFCQIAYRLGTDTKAVEKHLADALKHLVREVVGSGAA
jgi:DNA-directed RNA polymerase specialized sigma24 family protein